MISEQTSRQSRSQRALQSALFSISTRAYGVVPAFCSD
jgi:hypothetical protein